MHCCHELSGSAQTVRDVDGGDILWGMTCELLRPHRNLVIRLATALFHEKALSGDQIDALVYSNTQ
jgi:hypothetical protein